MMIVEQETTYKELVKVLSSYIRINRWCNHIHIYMNAKNSLNRLFYEVQDNHGVRCLIPLVQRMK